MSSITNNSRQDLPKGRNRESFDQFDDELAELILSYLPVEQLLKYESVSKQFQQCGSGSLTSIHLPTEWINHICYRYCQCCDTPEEKFAKHLMKKYPKISSVQLYENNNQVLMSIISNHRQLWPHLCSIENYMLVNKNSRLCDQQLDTNSLLPVEHMIRTLDVSSDLVIHGPKTWLKQFSRLDNLTVKRIGNVFADDDSKELLVKGLQSFKIDDLLEPRFVDQFRQFIAGNIGLRRLDTNYIPFTDDDDTSEDKVKQLFEHISRLKKLYQLDTSLHLLALPSIPDPLLLIANNCLQLSRLRLQICYDYEEIDLKAFIRTFKSVKQMHRLKHLDLDMVGENDWDNSDIDLAERHLSTKQMTDLQLTPKCWPQLTHLRIGETCIRLNTVVVNNGPEVLQSLTTKMPSMQRLVVQSLVFDNITEDLVMKSMDRQRSKLKLIDITAVDWTQPKPSQPYDPMITDSYRLISISK
ncbi:uncharacterized protein LOC128960770 [Oppia nitens]|uniref:uncharacterized protein LOC128960770 n=1 Tax=Oppia nitens TaxID=1686743 RepID=UPI0023DCBF6A|nr:uncharacterized protein LOC128960770 [Oppia nitens]